MAAGKMKVLMEVGRFNMNRSVELTKIHKYIAVQKCDFRGRGVPGELDGIAAVEAFKELELPHPFTISVCNFNLSVICFLFALKSENHIRT